MKLDSLDRQSGMPEPHDLERAISRASGKRRDDQLGRQSGAVDGQRMVSAGAKGARKPAEDPRAVVLDLGHFSMSDFARGTDLRAEDVGDRLMPQADSKNRNGAGKTANDVEADPRVGGSSGPR